MKIKKIDFPVTMQNGDHIDVVGHLYHKASGALHHKTLQVVLHGGSYNHRYWDAGVVNDEEYSYARDMAERGYAVLALDLYGSGDSDQPNGDLLDVEETSLELEQIIGMLRPGDPSDKPPGFQQYRFHRIVMVGHSLGSLTAVYTLGHRGPIVDALVVTGWAHAQHALPLAPEDFAALLAVPYPLFTDALRELLFYHLPGVDPDVIPYDHANLKDVVSRGMITGSIPIQTAVALGDDALTKTLIRVDQITTPVYVQLGEFDITAPASLAPLEEAFWSSAASFDLDVLLGVGHSFNLHLDRQEGWDKIHDWIDDNVCG